MAATTKRGTVPLRALDDDELVALFQEDRGRGVVEELLRRHEGAVRTVTRKFFLAGSDSEDVRQQALIGFWKAVRDYSAGSGASFHTFARSCMERHLITAVKAANRMKHAPLTKADRIVHHDTDTDADDGGPRAMQLPDISHEESTVAALALDELGAMPIDLTEVEQLVAQLGADAVHDLLALRMADADGRDGALNLSENEAHVLVGLIAGSRYREIAERMGRSEKFVDNTVQRLRRKFRAALTPDEALTA